MIARIPTCLVVDDEPEIRAHVARLARSQGLSVLAEAENAGAALDFVRRLSPDIMFVDIKMPGLTGLELLAALRAEAAPPVAVLVTAFEEHALAAFELSAVDYVTKPIDRERFAVAVQRAVELAQGRQARAALQRLNSVLSHSRPEVLSFREGTAVVTLRPSEVIRFAAMDDYVEAHGGNRSFLLSARIAALAAVLPCPPFLQVHRSHLVNMDHLFRLKSSAGRMTMIMRDGSEVPVSRSRVPEVRRLSEFKSLASSTRTKKSRDSEDGSPASKDKS